MKIVGFGNFKRHLSQNFSIFFEEKYGEERKINTQFYKLQDVEVIIIGFQIYYY